LQTAVLAIHEKGNMVLKIEARQRVIIENVRPEIDDGRYPIKRVNGEKVIVHADIFCDGHDALTARLLHKKEGASRWTSVPMRFVANDLWETEFVPAALGTYRYTVEAWVDAFGTWRHDLSIKAEAGQDVAVELLVGAEQIRSAATRAKGEDKKQLDKYARTVGGKGPQAGRIKTALGKELAKLMAACADPGVVTKYARELVVIVDPPIAGFSAWYERFPRSCSPVPGKHGTFADCEAILPEVARLGFDVLYLPPVHPIGKSHRKGKNNSPKADPGEPGSPWAIGSGEGGHTAIHPDLGTLDDFKRLVKKAGDHGLAIAMDLAYQCSPDHPYVKKHPDWFKWRPDGTVQYAENPPKKYQDVLPLNFETEDWKALWEELRNVVLFWIGCGVRIFRVDNPHTKPFAFWEWMIPEIKKKYPEVIFLAEAFTRPKVMYRLGKLGFTQSYTYFTWRTTKQELVAYLTELTQGEPRECFRPNFWPNTPDILPEHLQFGGRPTFQMRLVMAATLSSNYGIYGPVFELGLSEPRPGVEEYLDNEKYEIKAWDWDRPGNLKDFITRVNRIRRGNPALHETNNLRFFELPNDQLIAYGKKTEDGSNAIVVIVNLDPHHTQSGWVQVPLEDLGVAPGESYMMHDLLSDEKYLWHGEWNYVELNPHKCPAHIFKVKKHLKREMDFDYFM
jgi:starch synthase (maltosyl-transferring)